MGLRAVIVEQNEEDRKLLRNIFSGLGHEVIVASGPEFCQAYRDGEKVCRRCEPCHDVQILNNLFNNRMTGLEFISWQRSRCCKINASNSSVLSVAWPPSEIQSVDRLGVTAFTKPFLVKELVDWLYQAQNVKRSCRQI